MIMGMKYDFLYDEIFREGVDKDKLLDNVDLIRSTFGTSVKNYIKNKLSDHLSNTCKYPISPTTSNSIFLEIKYFNNDLILYDYRLKPIGDIFLTNEEIEATYAYEHNPSNVSSDLSRNGIQSTNINNRIYLPYVSSVNRVYNNSGIGFIERYNLFKNRKIYRNQIVCIRPLIFKPRKGYDLNDIKGIYAIVLDDMPDYNTMDSQGNIAPIVCYIGSQSKGISARVENFLYVNESDLKATGSSSYKFMNVYLNKFLEDMLPIRTKPYATIYALLQDVHISRSSEVSLINRYFDDPNYKNSPYKLNVTKAR